MLHHFLRYSFKFVRPDLSYILLARGFLRVCLEFTVVLISCFFSSYPSNLSDLNRLRDARYAAIIGISILRLILV